MKFPLFSPGKSPCLQGNTEMDVINEKLTERLRKTLYFGKHPDMDRPSVAVTDIAVEFFASNGPVDLREIDKDFAASVSRKACIGPCAMMLGMLYIERLKHRDTEYLQKVSSSDLFLISMMVSSKFMYDEGEDEEVYNDEWAASAKMETADVNQLEADFLKAIDWNLFVKPCEFLALLHRIEARIALQQGVDRGWFSFTDLDVLARDLHWNDLLKDLTDTLMKVVAVLAVSYLTAVLAIFGSVAAGHHARVQTHLHTSRLIDYLSDSPASHLDPLGAANVSYPAPRQETIDALRTNESRWAADDDQKEIQQSSFTLDASLAARLSGDAAGGTPSWSRLDVEVAANASAHRRRRTRQRTLCEQLVTTDGLATMLRCHLGARRAGISLDHPSHVLRHIMVGVP
ncbi:PREDICTED: protein CNPPD1-like [Priapulus caudatus]|uniref:Protein CNPPD1 n=1 Tax=Priapulus caudatus TaxID=37621 RepID=A0ABM1E9U0_PRICU|nr:PREDICTED: protein CNPPD1-like [Priapulus caudatus]